VNAVIEDLALKIKPNNLAGDWNSFESDLFFDAG